MKEKVTEIQVTPVKPNNGLVGFASFVLHGEIYCGSVAIFTRPDGSFRLVYPSRLVGSKQIQVFYPINRELGKEVSNAVISKFNDVVNNDRHSNFNYSKEQL